MAVVRTLSRARVFAPTTNAVFTWSLNGLDGLSPSPTRPIGRDWHHSTLQCISELSTSAELVVQLSGAGIEPAISRSGRASCHFSTLTTERGSSCAGLPLLGGGRNSGWLRGALGGLRAPLRSVFQQLAGADVEHVTERVEKHAVEIAHLPVRLPDAIERGEADAFVSLRHGVGSELAVFQQLAESDAHVHTFANDTTSGQSGQLWPVATIDDTARNGYLESYSRGSAT